MSAYGRVPVFAILCLLSFSLFATAQEGDILIQDGKEMTIFSNPLESRYSKTRPRPDFLKLTGGSCSANWRGYTAYWKIVKRKLYLVKLHRPCSWSSKDRAARMDQIIPKSKLPLFADWFSGKIRVPQGKRIAYVHMGYGSTYERDLFYTFKDGVLVDIKLVDNTQKKVPTRMESVQKELKKLKDWESGKYKYND